MPSQWQQKKYTKIEAGLFNGTSQFSFLQKLQNIKYDRQDFYAFMNILEQQQQQQQRLP